MPFALWTLGMLACRGPVLDGVAACRVYRPHLAKQTYDGRVGAVLLHNASSRDVEVKVYHPDGIGDVELRRRVAAGSVLVLEATDGSRLALGNDWGIQVDESCVATLGQAAAWAPGEFALHWDGDSLRAGTGVRSSGARPSSMLETAR